MTPQEAKDLLAQVAEAAKVAQQDPPAVKPGVKTTEFWLSLLAIALIQFSTIGFEGQISQSLAPIAGAVGSALVAMGYSASRGKAKGSDATPS